MSNSDIIWYVALAILFLLIGFYIFLRKTRDSNKKPSLIAKIVFLAVGPLYAVYKMRGLPSMNGPSIFILVILIAGFGFFCWLFREVNKTAKLQEIPEWTVMEFVKYSIGDDSVKKEITDRRTKLAIKAAEKRNKDKV